MEYIDEGETCSCGRVLLQPSTGRRRTKCLICSPRDRRDRRRPQAEVVALQVCERDPGESGSLTEASRRALTEAGVVDTWEAVAAICLAEAVDRGKTGASGPAGVIREHRLAMDHAMRNAGEEASIIEIIFAEN